MFSPTWGEPCWTPMFLRMSDRAACARIWVSVFSLRRCSTTIRSDILSWDVVGAGLLAPVKSKGSGCAWGSRCYCNCMMCQLEQHFFVSQPDRLGRKINNQRVSVAKIVVHQPTAKINIFCCRSLWRFDRGSAQKNNHANIGWISCIPARSLR